MNLKNNINAQKIWNFLIGKGLNEYGAAGVEGNFYAESGLKPNNLQNSYEKKLGYTDETYTAAVNSGAYKNFVHDSAGYGLAQWTHWSRKEALLNYAKAQKASIGDLDMQLNFFWKELSGYKTLLNTLKTATSVYEASTAFMVSYERPANQSDSNKKKRAELGQCFYDEFATSEPAVGDIVNFTGDTHYTNANAKTGKPCKPGKARITQIYQLGKSKHPYQLVATSGSTSNVCGWVNAEDITDVKHEEPYVPKIGDEVFYNGNVHYSNPNALIPKLCKGGLATIVNISSGTKHPYLLKYVKGSGATVYGWVNADTFIKRG